MFFEIGPERHGGIEDCLVSFDTLEEAMSFYQDEVYQDFDGDYLHYIYDRTEGAVIWCNDPDYIHEYF